MLRMYTSQRKVLPHLKVRKIIKLRKNAPRMRNTRDATRPPLLSSSLNMAGDASNYDYLFKVSFIICILEYALTVMIVKVVLIGDSGVGKS